MKLKKINMLKLSKILYCVTIILICTFLIVLSQVKIEQSITAKGAFLKDNNGTTFKFYSTESSAQSLGEGKSIQVKQIGAKDSYRGEVIKKRALDDIVLNEGKILECIIKLDAVPAQEVTGQTDNYSISFENRNNLLWIILSKMISS
mgnify:CR=1 FL=1